MQDVSLVSLVGRLAVSLGIVLLLMALLARLLRNRAMPGLGRGGVRRDVLEVVTRQSLSRTASVAVVRAAGRALVLGVTETGITLLAELSSEALEPDEEATGPIVPKYAWRDVVEGVRERTVRRGR